MAKQKRPRRDLIQNLLITVLAVSAVLLFAQSQLYTLGVTMGSDYLSRFTGTSADADPLHHDQTLALTAPVRVAVTGTYGRYGSVSLTTAAPEFEPLGTLLGEVLGSSRVYSASSETAFLHALSTGSSVYYDFCAPLPLSVLAGLMGTTAEGDELLVQRAVISDLGGDSVTLFLWDNGGVYLQCISAVSAGALLDTVSRYELGDAHFALDGALPDSEQLSPLSLFPKDLDDLPLPVYTASSATGGSERLLTALNFNPRTNLRYPDADGTEVIVEGERTLRLSPSGQILYQSGGEDILTISASEQTPTLRQAALGTGQLLTNLLGSHAGEASLYLRSVRQEEHRTTLEYDYHVDGIPVRFSDGAPAAVVTLHNNTVEELELRFRQYVSSGQPSLLLPLRQAMAVAGRTPGAELVLGYVDRGSETVSAQWLTL